MSKWSTQQAWSDGYGRTCVIDDWGVHLFSTVEAQTQAVHILGAHACALALKILAHYEENPCASS